MFGQMGDLMKLMGQAGKIRQNMEELQEKAKRRTVHGEAAGGLVKVTVNGAGEVLGMEISPEAMEDPELLTPLIVSATNAALKKSKEVMVEETQKAFGDIDLPPGMMGT